MKESAMLTKADEVTQWLKLQEEIVVFVSAFLAPVKTYLEKCGKDTSYVNDMTGIYELHTLVQNWNESRLLTGLTKLNLQPYYAPFRVPRNKLVGDTTKQTIPSKRQPGDEFIALIQSGVDAMSEVVVAFAKVPPPPFSVTLAAGTPFDAYLLVSRLIESAAQYVFIVDAYVDASLFDRYLYRVRDGVQVSLRTNPGNWNKRGWREQFEEAEALFAAQHPTYNRIDKDNLHARYLVTETGGWRIDGSIKDIASSKDCPIHTITPEERERVIVELFS